MSILYHILEKLGSAIGVVGEGFVDCSKISVGIANNVFNVVIFGFAETFRFDREQQASL